MLDHLPRWAFLLLCLTGCAVVSAVTATTTGYLITGTLSGTAGVLRPDAGVEVQGQNALISALNVTWPPDTDSEAAYVLGGLDGTGTPRKGMSLSAKWASSAFDVQVARLNASRKAGSAWVDDVGFRLWSGHGIRLFGGGCDDLSCAPGAQTLQVDGDVRLPQLPTGTTGLVPLCLDNVGNVYRGGC